MNLPALTISTRASRVREWMDQRGYSWLQLGIVLGAAVVVLGLVYMVIVGQARSAVAVAMIGLGWVICSIRPRLGMLCVMGFLPFLGEIRRLLLYVTGWSGYDPLQLVGPAFAGILLLHILLGRNMRAMTWLSRLILMLMLFMAVQVFNPLQGGLMVGIGGAYFYMVPLAWFWIGREYADEPFMRKLFFYVILPVSMVTAAMGIYQAFFGFLPHQQEWINQYGYTSLQVGMGKIRSFSTFSAASEFATFMSVASAVVIGVAIAAGRRSLLVLLPVLLLAIFVQASRGAMLSFVGLLALLWAVWGKDPQWWVFRLVGALVIGLSVGYFTLSAINVGSMDSEIAPIAQHQINGLTNPLDREHSTATAHGGMASSGMIRGFTQPWGLGLGATTLAASKFGGHGGSMEMDFSNLFVSLGAVGGLLYLAIIGWVIVLALRNWRQRRTEVALGVGGILAVVLGQWLNGGNYAIMPIVWVCVGYVDRSTAEDAKVARETTLNGG